MSKIDIDVPSNSEASKAANEAKNDIAPIADGRVEKKHQFLKRTLEVFSGQNIGDSADDVITQVIVPALWDLLRESVHALWDRILDKADEGGTYSPARYNNVQRVSNGNYIPYGSASAPKRSNVGRDGDFIDVVYFPTREKAEEVKTALEDIMNNDKNHMVTVEDYCSLANIKGDNNYMNRDWGWNDLRSAKIRHTLSGDYYITLPKVIPVKK